MRFRYSYRKKAKIFANSGDPDQTPRSVASDLGLHCLQITHLGISRLQWVNAFYQKGMVQRTAATVALKEILVMLVIC